MDCADAIKYVMLKGDGRTPRKLSFLQSFLLQVSFRKGGDRSDKPALSIEQSESYFTLLKQEYLTSKNKALLYAAHITSKKEKQGF